MKAWVLNNKLKVSCYSILAVYAYIHYKLFRLKHQLAQPENWSLWNNNVTLNELHAMDEQQLGEMLVIETQQRYTLIDDPENFITPRYWSAQRICSCFSDCLLKNK
jgi:hypothetical protein